MEDLLCPITLEYLETPITLPCCGKAVSKLPFLQHYEYNKNCPMCRQDLSHHDVANIPVSVNLAYLVERAQAPVPVPIIEAEEDSTLAITIHKLPNRQFMSKTVIGQMQITNTNQKIMFKHLVLVVTDRSGSMSGNPLTNTKYSITRIIDATYKNKHLITQIITYDDSAQSYEVNTSLPMVHYENIVKLMQTGGGTSFNAAFRRIEAICDQYKSDKSIGSISIVFLTDGEDSSVPANKRPELVATLKSNLDQINTVPYIVHSIGFGAGHDFGFLDKLKECGTTPGAYRYADPAENTDILSSKINSVLDVIVSSNNIPIKIVNSPLPIIAGGNDKYWVNLTGCDLSATHYMTLMIGEDDVVYIPATIVDAESDELWTQWYSYLIDEIAAELLALSTESNLGLSKKIHYELLHQRSKAILIKLDSQSSNATRLAKLLSVLESIKKGDKVDKLKLTDMKFEGKFETHVTSSGATPSIAYPKSITTSHSKKSHYDICDRKLAGRCKSDKNEPEHYQVIARYRNYDACNWINSHDIQDCHLRTAASIGRVPLVRTMMERCDDTSPGNNALDLAIIYGYWKTCEVLFTYGRQPSVNGQKLLRTCIHYGHLKTASLLLEHNIAKVTDDMMDLASTSKAVEWCTMHSNTEIDIDQAILKGMTEIVQKKLDTMGCISWKTCMYLVQQPTAEQIKIVDLLLSNGKVNPHEVFEWDDDVAWPLFMASKNGLEKMVDILIDYQTETTINMQNKKGTTALWIACCNKQLDIAMKLLIHGADPNLANFKGDSPLIPAIQKGSQTIAKLLLESGIKLDLYNKNRDNPIIICCRVGQVKILEMCLEYLSPSDKAHMLVSCADIDGFNPLLAAAEQDRVECINVCLAHGADIEFRTADDNKILPGATALHIACFYGKLSAVQTLCELGANLCSQTTIHQYTPLHVAIKQGHKYVVAFLMTRCRESCQIVDIEGRLPSHYASMVGNESIMEEFFTNKLAILMTEVMYSNVEMENECVHVLTKYGMSLGCYDNPIMDMEINQRDVFTTALLSKKNHLLKSLLTHNTQPSPLSVFWAKYLKYDMFPANEETNDMLQRVANISSKNIQNKMLMNVVCSMPKMIEYTSDVILQMTNGYKNAVNHEAITLVKKSQGNTHTILGFLEKLKNSKIFPDGKECLEYILWDAKIHMIEMIAHGEIVLQPTHLMAIYLYTSNLTIFQQVNATMAQWTTNDTWHPFVFCLYQAMTLVPVYQGDVYRMVDHVFDPTKYVIGSTFMSGEFGLTSTEWGPCGEMINRKKGIIFIIKSLSGRKLNSYSKFPMNAEVIFLPGTEFKVTDLYVGNIFALGQANIRKTSYRATENDLSKAQRSEICMMVELEEI